MRLLIGVLLVLLAAEIAGAEAGPATQPAVLVLAFDPVAADGQDNAIGQGIQQTLLAELGRMRHLRGTLPASQPAAVGAPVTPASALAAARAAEARYVVFGAYQQSQQLVRMTGQVLDVTTGMAVGSMKVTGTAANLFEMQDALCLQLRRILPAPVLAQVAAETRAAEPTVEERWPWRHSTSGGWRPAAHGPQNQQTQMDATMRRQRDWCWSWNGMSCGNRLWYGGFGGAWGVCW